MAAGTQLLLPSVLTLGCLAPLKPRAVNSPGAVLVTHRKTVHVQVSRIEVLEPTIPHSWACIYFPS